MQGYVLFLVTYSFMNSIKNKKVSVSLAIGIFLIPLIFAWFTLRRGYANSARIISFGWLITGFMLLAILPSPPTEINAAEAEATEIRKKFEDRKAELEAADRPQFEAPKVDYTTPVTKINIMDDQAILKAISKPIIDTESATNEYGEPMTIYWFSNQLAYGLEISLSREFIDVVWQFDSKNLEKANEAFIDGQRITRALLGGKDGSSLYEKISTGAKIEQLFLEDGTEIKKARCGERICRYQVIR